MRDPHAIVRRQDVSLAIRLAREAGAIVQRVAAEGFETAEKDGKGPVTRADRMADAHIKAALQQAFPEDGILTEEGGGEWLQRERIWVVDPLDGTKAFVKRIPGYSVMIGRLDGLVPTLGVVYDPVDGWLYAAAAGLGSWVWAEAGADPTEARIPREEEEGDRTLITTHSAKDESLSTLIQAGGWERVIRINSVGVKVGAMLRGEASVYYSLHGLSYWDTVAPVALAREAGAVVRHLDGAELRYDFSDPHGDWQHSSPILIGLPARVDAVLERLRDV